MSSIHIDREGHPGASDAEIAEALASQYGYVAVVRYKNSPAAQEFTNFGTCQTEDEIRAYLSSPHCHDAELIYDGRSTALRVTDATSRTSARSIRRAPSRSTGRASSIGPARVRKRRTRSPSS